MKIRLFLWIVYSIIEIICALYHELWHWMAGSIYFLLGRCDMPELIIDSSPRIELNQQGGFTCYGVCMSVRYSYNQKKMKNWMHDSITIAPAVGFFVLLMISPYEMVPLYIAYSSTLWLSGSDITKLNIKYL